MRFVVCLCLIFFSLKTFPYPLVQSLSPALVHRAHAVPQFTTDFVGDTHILTTTVLFGKELFAVANTSILTRGHLWREDQRTAIRDSGRTPGGAWGGAASEEGMLTATSSKEPI